MPGVLWSHEFVGFVRPLLGVNLAYATVHDKDLSPTALVCLDRVGNEAWRRDSSAGIAALPADHVLVQDEGVPVILDEHGSQVQTWRGKVDHVSWNSETILLADAEVVYLTTPNLEVTRTFPRPAGFLSASVEVLGEGVYWTEEDRLMAWAPDRGTRMLLELPRAEIVAAGTRYEARTGKRAFFGHWSLTLKDGQVQMIDPSDPSGTLRSWGRQWFIALDASSRLAFAYTALPPSVKAYVTLDGTVRWVEILSRFCCGGAPLRLPNGDYVANESCANLVVWFDESGRVLHEKAHDGILQVAVLDDGIVAVAEERAIVA
ncbi:MAG TPA: hypothetical protein VFF73_07750, partial [Planctomycetota bacterium]|nr:hypothetical protein [Planctomycetota bacterium]